MKKIITVVGARPQFIKAGIVSKELRKQFQEILVHTGQHYDKNMSDVFFEEMNIPRPNYNLEVGSGTHAVQTAKIMVALEKVLIKENPDGVLLYGDTNSTLAAAITASKLNIPVFHIEAGVRTKVFDMPEEQNRIVTDHLSSLDFACTTLSFENLKNEGLINKSFLVGDIMYDSLIYYKKKVEEINYSKYISSLKFLFNNTLLENDIFYFATCHRPENTDNSQNLKEILEALNSLEAKVLFSVHPRIKKQIFQFHSMYKNIVFVEPLSYFETINFTKHAKMVVTDSGGLHKEAYLLGVPCITVLRNGWEETLTGNWNEFVRPSKEMILASTKREIDRNVIRNQFGNGDGSLTIVNKINNFFK